MNKKSNFTRTVLLGALLCGIAGPSFVGCKDYDDDIDNLQVQIDQNKDAIAKLQELVNGGAIVTSVKSDGNGGVIITLSDGTTHNITKGEKGDDGDQGPDGVAGQTPIFQISNGELQVRYSTEDEWESLGKVTPEAEELNFVVDETTGDLMLNGTSIGHVAGEAGKPLAVDFRVTTEGVLEYQNQEGEWVEIGNVKGAEGATPQLVFQMVDGKLQYKDNNAIGAEWADVAGFDMSTILAGYMDLTVNAEDGFLYVGETKTDVQINYNIYLVEKEGAMILHLPCQNAEGKWEYRDITLPTTDIFGKVVTSVNFVPLTTEGKDLNVYSLAIWELKNGVYEKTEGLVRATPSELRFRVSPSTAVLGTDYTVAEGMDWFQITRAEKEHLFTATNARVENELVYVDFNFDAAKVDADETYTLALALNDKHNEGRVVYSDYITFKAEGEELSNVALRMTNDEEEKLEAIDLTKQKLEWVEGAQLDLSGLVAGIEENTEFTELSDFGFTPEFSIKFAGEEVEKDFIGINGMVLTLKDGTYQTYDQTIDFVVEIKANGELVGYKELKVKITDFETTAEFKLVSDVTVKDFISASETIPVKLDAEQWNAMETFFVDDMESEAITFTVKKDGKALTDYSEDLTLFSSLQGDPEVIVKAGVKAGVYEVTMSFTKGKKTATSTFTITLVNPILEQVPEYWDNEGNLVVRVNAQGALSADLNTAFVDIEGTDVAFASESKDITINEGQIALTNSGKAKLAAGGYYDVEISYCLVNEQSKDEITEKETCMVRFYNPIREPEFATKTITINDGTEVEIDMRELGIDLAVNDRATGSDLLIINDSEVVTDPEEGEALASTYKVTGITYASKDTRFEGVDAAKAIWKNGGSALTQPVEVKVTVTIANNWKTIEQEITIIVQPNK